ncbi:MAG: hypothetical protein KAX15_04405 [Candidatus Omnitrophica bacterium]|nr:hypothetical protein [Candidatus Omnitrophota bacterium]
MKTKPEIPPKKFWEDEKWAHKNYQELVKKYTNMWVAVSDKKVVCANENLRLVEEMVTRKFGKKDVPLMHVEDGAHVY